LKWEDYIDDIVVREALQTIRDRVSKKGSSQPQETMTGSSESLSKSTSEVNVSDAKRVKLVVVGDGAVGKTSLLIRYATGNFPTEYLPTVFENYTAQMKRENEVILLHLWDTAGQEDYDRLRPLSYPGADIVLLCFSTISKASFEAIQEKWAPEISHYIPNIPHLLIGTKIDLREEKHPDPNSGKFEPTSTEQGREMCTVIHATKYLEVSSKTGQGINAIFEEAVNLVLDQRPPPGTPSKTQAKPGKRKKEGGCLLL